MAGTERTIRMFDAISPFGVGAIVDILGESFIATDISWWPEESRILSCKRLERQLGVGMLKSPPSTASTPSKDSPSLRFDRFPAWRFCQNCRRMSNGVKRVAGVVKNECVHCNGPMVPMRFVVVCETGSHVADVPWKLWVHRHARDDSQSQCQAWDLLEFVTSSGGFEGLSSLSVVCRACDSRRHLGELTVKGNLGRDGFKCRGRQPWQPKDGDYACESPLQAVQRGTASLHIAEVITAIDIPESVPQSVVVSDVVRAHSLFTALTTDPDGPAAQVLTEMISRDTGVPASTVITVARESVPTTAVARSGLRDGEWAAFDLALAGKLEEKASDFVVDGTPLKPGASEHGKALDNLVSSVGLVQRIREVRALTGFRRYDASANLVSVDLGGTKSTQKWYPAHEQFGEGIFVRFSEQRLNEWESQAGVKSRIVSLEKRRIKSNVGSRFEPVTARMVLLHTLSHLLIRSLAFASGYSSASMRERIYANVDGSEPQAGILIYTAAGDVEGTLGGLVRQGEAPHFARTLLRSIEDADACSNDPVCRESRGQGMDALNLAACHGCSLVAETSCESANLFLDRVLLAGDDHVPGFFDDVLRKARSEL